MFHHISSCFIVFHHVFSCFFICNALAKGSRWWAGVWGLSSVRRVLRLPFAKCPRAFVVGTKFRAYGWCAQSVSAFCRCVAFLDVCVLHGRWNEFVTSWTCRLTFFGAGAACQVRFALIISFRNHSRSEVCGICVLYGYFMVTCLPDVL